MARGKKKIVVLAPPKEQESAFALVDVIDKGPGGTSIMIGKAYRRQVMIDVLAKQGVLSPEQHKALRHYRHHADIADRSPLRDTLAKLVRIDGGAGTGPTVELLNAIRVRDDCERAAGSLADILRAVVVYDISLSQWAIDHNGAIEKCRQRRGRTACTIEAKAGALRIAKMEIQIAAQRVQSELDA